MKKSVSLMLILLMLVTALGAFAVPTAAAAASTFEAQKASSIPTIDGTLDEDYLRSTEIIIDKPNAKGGAVGNTSGKAYVLWDYDYMYVFFQVTDPYLSENVKVEGNGPVYWKRDSVEFFCDLSGSIEGSLLSNINAGQWQAAAPFTGSPDTWGVGRGMHQYDDNKANSELARVATATGYNIEMKIPWGSGYEPLAGEKIGVVFHINSDEIADGQPGAAADGREYEYFAGYGQADAWESTKNWDKLLLVSDNPADYVAPDEGNGDDIVLDFGDGGDDTSDTADENDKKDGDKEETTTSSVTVKVEGCGSVIGGAAGVACVASTVAAVLISKKKKEK